MGNNAKGNRILTGEELEQINNDLNYFGETLNNSLNHLNTIINSLDNENVVNSFFVSGEYGAEVKRNLQTIQEQFKKYVDTISTGEDSLLAVTRNAVSVAYESRQKG